MGQTDSANAASVALVADGRVLLIKRAYAPYRHLWTLPGGRSDPGETAEHCAIREVREELGLTISSLAHVETQALTSTRGDWRLAVFVSAAFSGKIVPSDEVADHRWLALADIGTVRTTSRLNDVLERAFARLAAT